MEIEERIRTRIEAILVNDAKNITEIKRMASTDDPFDANILADEYNLYQRIINSYRSAVNEVNKLLEENIGSLSSFYQIVENIKEKQDFKEICSRIVDCLIQDYKVDYCSLLFPEGDETLFVEGICEERKFFRIHSQPSLLKSKEFEFELTRLSAGNCDYLMIEDIYKDLHFSAYDFPVVFRSILCLPILLSNKPVGFLILSHSRPGFFNANHTRVLKILGGLIAHLRLLHDGGRIEVSPNLQFFPSESSADRPDIYSVVLMEFESRGAYGSRMPLDKDIVREIRRRIRRVLAPEEFILFYEDRALLVLLPGVGSELLSTRILGLRQAFCGWQAEDLEIRSNTQIHLGFSVCEGDVDLSRTLEMATLAMHPDSEEFSVSEQL
jgi:hypothetical protein